MFKKYKLAEILIRICNESNIFRGTGGGYNFLEFDPNTNYFPQSKYEADLYEEFFRYFNKLELCLIKKAIKNKKFLDFGSGYGGRTVEYVKKLEPSFTNGLEIDKKKKNASEIWANYNNIRNIKFSLSNEKKIDFNDEEFDCIISYDVLEHVIDPKYTLNELYRIAKKDAILVLRFPVYDGLMSHHLDGMTTIPGLHLIFDPFSLNKAYNSILDNQSKSFKCENKKRTKPQKSHDGSRYVLNGLNGMKYNDFLKFIEKFSILNSKRIILKPLRYIPFINKFINLFPSRVRDIFTSTIVCILQK